MPLDIDRIDDAVSGAAYLGLHDRRISLAIMRE
jgi:hypothetical protein